MKNNKKGFTIVELVIVIAVIAILAAVLIPTFSTVIANANETAAMEQANTTKTAVLVLTNGTIPDNSVFYILDQSPVQVDRGEEKNVTSGKTGTVKYAYQFNNGKLGRIEELSAKNVYFQSTDNYTVYVSSKYLQDDTLVKDATKIENELESEVVANQIAAIIGFKECDSVSVTPSADKGHIIVTYTSAKFSESETKDKVTVNVYWSSDILDTSIAFMYQAK